MAGSWISQDNSLPSFSGSNTQAEPQTYAQQLTGLLTVGAWVAGGGILVYLLWPVIVGARDRIGGGGGGSGSGRGFGGYEPEEDSRYAETYRSPHRSRRKVSVQFEE